MRFIETQPFHLAREARGKGSRLKAALALHFAWYNFVRIHSSLKTTPAAAAGITGGPWELRDLLAWEASHSN